MAKIQLVIEIEERIYKNIIDNDKDDEEFEAMDMAFCNAKPLPKGHGDLIDRRSFRENIDMCYPFTKYWQEHNPVLNMAKSELLLCLESEPTIIEAEEG